MSFLAAAHSPPQLQVNPRLVFHTAAAAEPLSPHTQPPCLSHTDATGPCADTLHVKMPISKLVECAVNLAENVTGVDIDRDGDIGVRCALPRL